MPAKLSVLRSGYTVRLCRRTYAVYHDVHARPGTFRVSVKFGVQTRKHTHSYNDAKQKRRRRQQLQQDVYLAG